MIDEVLVTVGQAFLLSSFSQRITANRQAGMPGLPRYARLGPKFMSNQRENSLQSQSELSAGRLTRRRRIVLWTLGITVFLLLSIIVSQQLWLWTIIPPDTASDTLLLYALSTLNFVAFVVFSFIFVRNLLKLRRERRERQLGSKIKTRLLVYFIAISFLPIIAMAVFSYLFLARWKNGLAVSPREL
jgi:magnesium-transporting ATPase (P-type)